MSTFYIFTSQTHPLLKLYSKLSGWNFGFNLIIICSLQYCILYSSTSEPSWHGLNCWQIYRLKSNIYMKFDMHRHFWMKSSNSWHCLYLLGTLVLKWLNHMQTHIKLSFVILKCGVSMFDDDSAKVGIVKNRPNCVWELFI